MIIAVFEFTSSSKKQKILVVEGHEFCVKRKNKKSRPHEKASFRFYWKAGHTKSFKKDQNPECELNARSSHNFHNVTSNWRSLDQVHVAVKTKIFTNIKTF